MDFAFREHWPVTSVTAKVKDKQNGGRCLGQDIMLTVPCWYYPEGITVSMKAYGYVYLYVYIYTPT